MINTLIKTISIFLLFTSLKAFSTQSEIEGFWSGNGDRPIEVYGYIKIIKSNIFWGRNKKEFPCKAQYEVVLKGEDDTYPDNFRKFRDNMPNYKYYKLKLINKECNYEAFMNPGINKKLGYIQLALPSDEHNRAELNTYDHSNKKMGFGVLRKYSHEN